jgi:hypothetical protein
LAASCSASSSVSCSTPSQAQDATERRAGKGRQPLRLLTDLAAGIEALGVALSFLLGGRVALLGRRFFDLLLAVWSLWVLLGVVVAAKLAYQGYVGGVWPSRASARSTR